MSDPTLYALVGPPGAGKSTLRAALVLGTGMQVVSLDQLRAALSPCGCAMNQHVTPAAVAAGLAAARHTLTEGRDVLWDATNATLAARAALLALATDTGTTPVAAVLLPPLPVVLERNAARNATPCVCGYSRRVPEDVVVRMHEAITADLPNLAAEGWARFEVKQEGV